MAQYKTGTATFTNGSSTVTGSGTAWASNLSAGDYIVRKGDALNTYQAYQIGGINSNTSLTLTAPYGGSTASNVSYVAHVDFIDNDRPELSNGDIETAAIINRWIASIAQLAQLGTAANLDVQTSSTDTNPNAVRSNDSVVIGSNGYFFSGDVDTLTTFTSSPIRLGSGCTSSSAGAILDGGDWIEVLRWDDNAVAQVLTKRIGVVGHTRRYIRSKTSAGGPWSNWDEQYTTGSLNTNLFKSGGLGDRICTGFAASPTLAAFHLPISFVDQPTSIQISGNFNVFRPDGSLIAANKTNLLLDAQSCAKLALIVIDTTGGAPMANNENLILLSATGVNDFIRVNQ